MLFRSSSPCYECQFWQPHSLVIGMRKVYSGEFVKLIMYLTFANWWTLHVYNCLNLDQVMQFRGGIVNPLRCGEILMCTGK